MHPEQRFRNSVHSSAPTVRDSSAIVGSPENFGLQGHGEKIARSSNELVDSSSSSGVSEDSHAENLDSDVTHTPILSEAETAASLKSFEGERTLLPERLHESLKGQEACTIGAIEVFCGCAELAKQLGLVGFDAVGIDWRHSRDKARHKCVYTDLGTADGRQQFWEIVASNKVQLVWFAPPCGTACAARSVRRMDSRGRPALLDPQPLRSKAYPDGILGLSGKDAAKVAAANALYHFVTGAVSKLDAQRISWAVENPSNSLMLLVACSWKPVRASVFEHLLELINIVPS